MWSEATTLHAPLIHNDGLFSQIRRNSYHTTVQFSANVSTENKLFSIGFDQNVNTDLPLFQTALCDQHANCNRNVSQDAGCRCDWGFKVFCEDKQLDFFVKGDGFTCEDINECDNPIVCKGDKGHGTCVNSYGSYYCLCPLNYRWEWCMHYELRRHCADLQIYNRMNTSGWYWWVETWLSMIFSTIPINVV